MTEQSLCLFIFIQQKELVTSWQDIGKSEGLETDIQIAKFLINLYKQVTEKDSERNSWCLYCQHPLFTLPPPRQEPLHENLQNEEQKVKRGASDTESEEVTGPDVPELPAVTSSTSYPVVSKQEEDLNANSTEEILDTEASFGTERSHSRFPQSVIGNEPPDFKRIELVAEWSYNVTGDKTGGSKQVTPALGYDSEDNCDHDKEPVLLECEVEENEDSNSTIIQTETQPTLTKPKRRVKAIPAKKRNESKTKTSKGCSPSARKKKSGKKENADKSAVCPVCNATFTARGSLNSHMFIHTGEKPYQCSHCEACFRQSSSLKSHLNQVHSTVRPFQCPHCPKDFKMKKILNKHLESHQPGPAKRPFKCPECPSSFTMSSHLSRHILVHRGEKPFVCNECGVAYSQNANLKTHIEKKHLKKYRSFCDICGKGFLFNHELLKHKAKHNDKETNFKLVCETCGKRFRNKHILLLHETVHTDSRPYPCEECGRTFKSTFSLCLHKKTHSVRSPVVCELCGKSFKSKISLYSHKKSHSAIRSFVCEVCGRTFKSGSSLKMHLKTHSDAVSNKSVIHVAAVIPYPCDECDKTFKSKFYLKRHKKSHIVCSVECEFCGKCFKSRGSLTNHKKSHRITSPVECDICGKSFNSKASLYNHKKSHSVNRPFVCEVCGKTFKGSASLKMHAKSHYETGADRPYSCETCGKRFKLKTVLDIHIKSHNLPKNMFDCENCGKAFKRQSSLANHRRSGRCEIVQYGQYIVNEYSHMHVTNSATSCI